MIELDMDFYSQKWKGRPIKFRKRTKKKDLKNKGSAGGWVDPLGGILVY